MLFAESETFWKSPNIFDILGAIGFLIGILSVWFAWALSKKDIRKQIREAADRSSQAARDEVRRVARALVHTGISDSIRMLDLAREACRGKLWPRAGELCEIAGEHLVRALPQPALAPGIAVQIQSVSPVLLDCVTELRRQPRSRTGEVPAQVLRGLDESILALHGANTMMTAIQMEIVNG